MANTINGRTPEEIKKGLECCNTYNDCQQCPYDKADGSWACTVERNADTLAYIQQLEAAQPKWISVEERLPDVVAESNWDKRTEYALAIEANGSFHVGRFYIFKFDGNYEFVSGYERPDVTHWMPLPQPPKEDA